VDDYKTNDNDGGYHMFYVHGGGFWVGVLGGWWVNGFHLHLFELYLNVLIFTFTLFMSHLHQIHTQG
jgi:hypothetical protein